MPPRHRSGDEPLDSIGNVKPCSARRDDSGAALPARSPFRNERKTACERQPVDVAIHGPVVALELGVLLPSSPRQKVQRLKGEARSENPPDHQPDDVAPRQMSQFV